MPASVLVESAAAGGADATNALRPPRVEYLATLSRHSAAVNVVRFSPNGECVFQFVRRSGVQVARMVGCQMTPLTSIGPSRTGNPLPETNTPEVIVRPFYLCRS